MSRCTASPFSTARSQQRSLRLESLENRKLKAGDVIFGPPQEEAPAPAEEAPAPAEEVLLSEDEIQNQQIAADALEVMGSVGEDYEPASIVSDLAIWQELYDFEGLEWNGSPAQPEGEPLENQDEFFHELTDDELLDYFLYEETP